jgi:hypothetical protein
MERWRGNLVGICIEFYVIVQRLYVKVILWKKSEQPVAVKFLRRKELGARSFTRNYLRSSAMSATVLRRLNIGLPAFARAIFHAPIILDQVAQ